MRAIFTLLFFASIVPDLPTANANLVALGPWSGAVTPYSAVVVSKLNTPRLSTLKVSEQPFFSHAMPIGESAAVPGEQPEIARFTIRNLRPDTRYYYRIRAGAERDDLHQGSFTTFPAEDQPASFSFAFSSAADTGSTHGVFAELKYDKPLFTLLAGDLFTPAAPPDSPPDRSAFSAAYNATLDSRTQGDFYRAIPIVYTWRDTDCPAVIPARAAFNEYAPHYPLAADADPSFPADHPDTPAPITQAFTVGRVRFLVLDTTSQRRSGDVLGDWQTDWLQRQLLAAQGRYPLTFIVTALPWIGDPGGPKPTWSDFPAARARLCDWIASQALHGLCLLTAGPAPAADDGTHAGTDSDHPLGFPVLQAGPLDQPVAPATGRWTVAPAKPRQGDGFFGLVKIEDHGAAIAVDFRGINQDSRELLRYTFTASP